MVHLSPTSKQHLNVDFIQSLLCFLHSTLNFFLAESWIFFESQVPYTILESPIMQRSCRFHLLSSCFRIYLLRLQEIKRYDVWIPYTYILPHQISCKSISWFRSWTWRHTAWWFHKSSSFLQLTQASQWPRGLSHELSSLARTLWSCDRIPLKAWMSVLCAFILVLCCVEADALRRADPPSKES
jgi:hypothetical protein